MVLGMIWWGLAPPPARRWTLHPGLVEDAVLGSPADAGMDRRPRSCACSIFEASGPQKMLEALAIREPLADTERDEDFSVAVVELHRHVVKMLARASRATRRRRRCFSRDETVLSGDPVSDRRLDRSGSLRRRRNS